LKRNANGIGKQCYIVLYPVNQIAMVNGDTQAIRKNQSVTRARRGGTMSVGSIEHHLKAADHHEKAARLHREAANCHAEGRHGEASNATREASGHLNVALLHAAEAEAIEQQSESHAAP
jgi:hypothetical protein